MALISLSHHMETHFNQVAVQSGALHTAQTIQQSRLFSSTTLLRYNLLMGVIDQRRGSPAVHRSTVGTRTTYLASSIEAAKKGDVRSITHEADPYGGIP